MLFVVFEVYMGFVFFGVAYFAAFSDLFKDPDAASVTLFALLNGDVIHDVFDAIYDASPCRLTRLSILIHHAFHLRRPQYLHCHCRRRILRRKAIFRRRFEKRYGRSK
eukprot:UN24723